jgi:hypothetical protein
MAITKEHRKRLRRDDGPTSASVPPQSYPRDAGVSDPFDVPGAPTPADTVRHMVERYVALRRADPAVPRHTGTAQPNQPHVPTHVLLLCRSKCLIQRRCAGVSPAKRKAIHA